MQTQKPCYVTDQDDLHAYSIVVLLSNQSFVPFAVAPVWPKPKFACKLRSCPHVQWEQARVQPQSAGDRRAELDGRLMDRARHMPPHAVPYQNVCKLKCVWTPPMPPETATCYVASFGWNVGDCSVMAYISCAYTGWIGTQTCCVRCNVVSYIALIPVWGAIIFNHITSAYSFSLITYLNHLISNPLHPVRCAIFKAFVHSITANPTNARKIKSFQSY
jgi:hypothetical protein